MSTCDTPLQIRKSIKVTTGLSNLILISPIHKATILLLREQGASLLLSINSLTSMSSAYSPDLSDREPALSIKNACSMASCYPPHQLLTWPSAQWLSYYRNNSTIRQHKPLIDVLCSQLLPCYILSIAVSLEIIQRSQFATHLEVLTTIKATIYSILTTRPLLCYLHHPNIQEITTKCKSIYGPILMLWFKHSLLISPPSMDTISQYHWSPSLFPKTEEPKDFSISHLQSVQLTSSHPTSTQEVTPLPQLLR